MPPKTIRRFELWMRNPPNSGSYNLYANDIGPDTFRYKRTGLTANTEYEAKLKVVFTDGTEMQSGDAEFRTKPTPLQEPTDFHLVSRTTNSVTVGWNTESENLDYTITYRRAGTGDYRVVATISNSSGDVEDTIENLSPGTDYDIRLTVGDEHGQSKRVTRTYGTSVDAPTVSSASTTATSATISWNYDGKSTNGIAYQQVERGTRKIVGQTSTYSDYQVVNNRVSTSSKTHTDRTVKPSEGYRYRVVAVGNNGEKVYSEPRTGVVTLSLPPRNLKQDDSGTSENIIAIGWEKPREQDQSNISGFHVLYRKQGTSDDFVTQFPLENQSSANSSQAFAETARIARVGLNSDGNQGTLEAGTTYEIRVETWGTYTEVKLPLRDHHCQHQAVRRTGRLQPGFN